MNWIKIFILIMQVIVMITGIISGKEVKIDTDTLERAFKQIKID